MICDLVILNEVIVQFVGITSTDTDVIIERTKMPVKDARHTAAYKMGSWDGKESLFQPNGCTFFYLLDEVIPIVEELGYEVEIHDEREDFTKPDHIDENLFQDYGIVLRRHQVESTNALIDNSCGIMDIGTGGGKTLGIACIAKVFEPHRTIVIVPSEYLANQTYKEMEGVGLDVGVVHGGIKGNKRKKMFEKEHLVITWQTLKNNRSICSGFHVVLYDEAHEMGDIAYGLLTNELGHAYIRCGLTGTVPHKDKLKRQKLFSHIGNGVIYIKESDELSREGHIATCDVTMHRIIHHIDLPYIGLTEEGCEYDLAQVEEFEWDLEKRYLDTDLERIDAIADFIRPKLTKNTLILTHPVLGKKLADILELDFIDQEVKNKDRERMLAKFDKGRQDLVASYGTVGTGVSVNDIYQGFLIDVGQNEVYTVQGIGRMVRKDSQGINHIKVFDVYSGTHFSGGKHYKERTKTYRKKKFPYKEGRDIVI